MYWEFVLRMYLFLLLFTGWLFLLVHFLFFQPLPVGSSSPIQQFKEVPTPKKWHQLCVSCRTPTRGGLARHQWSLDVPKDGVDGDRQLRARLQPLDHVIAVGAAQGHVLDAALCKGIWKENKKWPQNPARFQGFWEKKKKKENGLAKFWRISDFRWPESSKNGPKKFIKIRTGTPQNRQNRKDYEEKHQEIFRKN